MRKELKEKLLKFNYRLYEKEWVEKTATDGFNRAMEGVREKEPAFAAVMDKCLWPFEVMYYTAFEDALNTFLIQCIGDDVTKIELFMDELHKVTANIIKKRNEKKG